MIIRVLKQLLARDPAVTGIVAELYLALTSTVSHFRLLHIAVAQEQDLFVRALLTRLQREQLVPQLINARNVQQHVSFCFTSCASLLGLPHDVATDVD